MPLRTINPPALNPVRGEDSLLAADERRPRRMSALQLVIAMILCSNVAHAEDRTPRPSVRDVTPSGVTRVYGAPEGTKYPTADPVNERVLENLQVLADGTIKFGDQTFSLFGVSLPERNKMCVTRSGSRWACGLSAIGALRQMIQGKSVVCAVTEDNAIRACRLGRIDISLRLLEQGWAIPDARVKDDRYANAARDGMDRQLGMWSSGPTVAR